MMTTVAIFIGIYGLVMLFDSASWTGDHSGRHRNFFVGGVFLLVAFVLWRLFG